MGAPEDGRAVKIYPASYWKERLALWIIILAVSAFVLSACSDDSATATGPTGGTGSERNLTVNIIKTELGYVTPVEITLVDGRVVQCVILDSWDGGGGITCDFGTEDSEIDPEF